MLLFLPPSIVELSPLEEKILLSSPPNIDDLSASVVFDFPPNITICVLLVSPGYLVFLLQLFRYILHLPI